MTQKSVTRDRPKAYKSRRRVLLQDVAFSELASLLSILFMRWLSEPSFGFTSSVLVWLACGLLATVTGIALSDSSAVVKRYTTTRTLQRVLASIGIKEVLMLAVLLTGLVKTPSAMATALLMSSDVLFTSLFLLYLRWTARLVREEHEAVAELSGRKTAVVRGTSPQAVLLMEELEKGGTYDVVAFITDDPALSGRILEEKPVYYCVDDVRLRQLQWMFGGIDCIFCPRDGEMPGPAGHDDESGHNDRTDHTPATGNADNNKETPQASESIPMPDRMSLAQYMVKRAFDTGLSAVLLVVFSPLLAVCAIAVKLEDGGPVIYKQERIGRGGKPFYIYKLRSMRLDAENGRPVLYKGNEDSRVTRVGRFFRQHHLDELPQLYNVFRGDMSFIGYRPERKYYIDKIMERDPRYRYLYQIRPGVTSYATLYNGYTDSLEKMLRRLDLDLYYLRNHSLAFDAKVLGLTFLSIVGGKKF